MSLDNPYLGEFLIVPDAFSVNTPNWKLEQKIFYQKCHSVKNTFLLPNLHTSIPKQVIKEKNVKIWVKMHFFGQNCNIGENE